MRWGSFCLGSFGHNGRSYPRGRILDLLSFQPNFPRAWNWGLRQCRAYQSGQVVARSAKYSTPCLFGQPANWSRLGEISFVKSYHILPPWCWDRILNHKPKIWSQMGSGKKPIWFKFAWNISSRLLEIRVLFCRQGQCPARSQYQDPNLFASHRLLDFFTILLSAFLVFDYWILWLFALLSLVKSFAHQVSYCAWDNPFLFNGYWQMILPSFFT